MLHIENVIECKLLIYLFICFRFKGVMEYIYTMEFGEEMIMRVVTKNIMFQERHNIMFL